MEAAEGPDTPREATQLANAPRGGTRGLDAEGFDQDESKAGAPPCVGAGQRARLPVPYAGAAFGVRRGPHPVYAPHEVSESG